MSDPSLLFLPMLPVEKNGWLTLYVEGQEAPMTAQALVGHVDQDSAVFLALFPDVVPVDLAVSKAEFRFVDKTGVYTFSSSQLEIELREEQRMILRMLPVFEMVHHQQREFIRVKPVAPLPVAFVPLFPDGYESGTGTIIDMSGNGLRFSTTKFIHGEAVLKLSFQLPDSPRKIMGVAKVVRKEFARLETVTSMQFLELDSKDQRSMIAYSVAEQLRKAENEKKQRRKFMRVNLKEPMQAIIRSVGNDTDYPAIALNIGGGGIMVQAPADIEEAMLYFLTFTLPNTGKVIETYVTVVTRVLTEEAINLHLEFIDIGEKDQDQEAIIRFVMEARLEQIEPRADSSEDDLAPIASDSSDDDEEDDDQ
ncbi:PilZ domain-containing protein [Brevibacillus dissolubilis]|uniref:PilZ domain-containing protein n=1 Tax=Brevibacillus dissolubilis TaxID=1844116 RepID=UPI00111758FB|nr:PilZ domain-containing protein [Brevibacillus dissolubilis]